MAVFSSPFVDPTAWNLEIRLLVLPETTRYPMKTVRAVRCTSASAQEVMAPAASIVHVHTEGALGSIVEVEPHVFPIREALQAIRFGLPTFYFYYPNVSDTVFVALPNTLLAAQDTITTAMEVWIALVGQDRSVLDPALWSETLLESIPIDDRPLWQPFHDRLVAQTVTNVPSVILLDHAGQPLTGDMQITLTSGSVPGQFPVSLLPEHGGDLQRAVADATLEITEVFAGGATLALISRIDPDPSNPTNDQWVRWEDGMFFASGAVELTPELRHASVTNLHAWFASQAVDLPDTDENSNYLPNLARFTRGNTVRPLVDGMATFAKLIEGLDEVREGDGGAHFAGWDLHGDFDLIPVKYREDLQKRFPELDLTDDRDLSLQALIEGLGITHPVRFLITKKVQIPPETPLLGVIIVTAVLLWVIFSDLAARGVKSFETNQMGGWLAFLAMGAVFVLAVLINQDELPTEPSKDSQEALDDLDHVKALLVPYLAEQSDNPIAGGVEIADFGNLNRYGVYHQKLIVLNRNGRLAGYVGGIDINPNRLDDPDHLAGRPYHDVHVHVEGSATIDLAQTFQQRWLDRKQRLRDEENEEIGELAFDVADVDPQDDGGSDIVQVARTYFKTNDSSRRLPYAPDGDFTVKETLVQAIESAREYIYIEDQYLAPPQVYRTALLEALDRIERLIIVIPNEADQPLGDLHRREFINELRTKAPTKVRVGNPVRRPVVPANTLRASEGKCWLIDRLGPPGPNQSVHLGPKLRVPAPPFWLFVGGELMLAYDHPSGQDPPPDPPEKGIKLSVLRGLALGMGTHERGHLKDTPAMAVAIDAIFVHAKMMIIDDLFVSVGSTNLNRRGLFHDGEINLFSVPETLRFDPHNLARKLRMELWADHLNLPEEIAAPLVADPVRGSDLFDRGFFEGNRFVDVDLLPISLAWNRPLGSSWLTFIIEALVAGVVLPDFQNLYDTVIDPTTGGT